MSLASFASLTALSLSLALTFAQESHAQEAFGSEVKPMTFEQLQQMQADMSQKRDEQIMQAQQNARIAAQRDAVLNGGGMSGGMSGGYPGGGQGQVGPDGQPRGANPPMQLPPIDIPKQSYREAQTSVMPMTPEEIRRFKGHIEETREANRPVVESKPVTGSETLDLQPGSPPPVVRVAVYHGSAINFVDATGAPWPIAGVTNFNKKDFEVSIPFENSSTITVSNLGYYGTGNLAVFLKGFSTPITVGLYGNQKETDYRKDFRLLYRIPGAADPIPSNGTDAASRLDSRILRFVDGIPPEGGVRINTDEPLIKAYRLDSKLVIRTQLTLLSAFDARVPGSDGTAVYVMPLTPVASVSENGKPRRVFFKY